MADLQMKNSSNERYNSVENLADNRSLMVEVLQKIRHRPRLNPISFGLLDSTILIREDRDR